MIELNSSEEQRMGMARQLVVQWKFVRLLLSRSLACFTSNYSSHCFSVSVSGMEQRDYTVLVPSTETALYLCFILYCRWLCARNRKVAGSIPAGVIEIFH